MAQAERTSKCLLFLQVSILLAAAVNCVKMGSEISGYRIVDRSELVETGEDDKVVVYGDVDVEMRLFGNNFGESPILSFTNIEADKYDDCTDLRNTGVFQLFPDTNNSAVVVVNLPVVGDTEVSEDETGYLMPCLKLDTGNWIHQGRDPWIRIYTVEKPTSTTILPLWIQILLIILLLCFSGLFSGLNLGLMALDPTELKILINSGSGKERKYAKIIAPMRKHGNYLLCTILIGNVLVNNTLTILLDDLTGSGYAAVLGATAGIVVFGEIIPQAVCSRYGLAVGANTIWFTKFFMFVTFPLSFPISKLLDCVLGEEIGSVYNRDRLRELIRLTATDLINDEVNIITGALQLSKKKVEDIMTRLDDVYMIDINSVLDFDTMNDIMKTGFTRIPVYETEKTNIIAILNIKDLAFIDPDDKTPLKTVCAFYKHPVTYVFEDIKLSEILQQFKEGRSHMAFVRKIHNEGPGDPYYEIVGVVTLEDVIEEIIQSEIVDETDTITDNRKKARREAQVRDFSFFNKPDELQEMNFPKMSPQLALATYQYLHTTVPPFKQELISDLILQRLIKQNIVHEIKVKNQTHEDDLYIYQAGKKCDYFVLILQGRVEVCIGKEQMTFESGPFTYFGVQALIGSSGNHSLTQSKSSLSSSDTELSYSTHTMYTPDFSVKVASDFVQFIKIHRNYYEAARRATAMEMSSTHVDDFFTREWRRITDAGDDGVITNSVKSDRTDRGTPPLASAEKVTPTSQSSIDGDVRSLDQQIRSDTQVSHGTNISSEQERTQDGLSTPSTPLIQNCDITNEKPC